MANDNVRFIVGSLRAYYMPYGKTYVVAKNKGGMWCRGCLSPGTAPQRHVGKCTPQNIIPPINDYFPLYAGIAFISNTIQMFVRISLGKQLSASTH